MSGPPAPRYKNVTKQVFDPGALASGIFASLATGETPNVAALVPNAYKSVTSRVLMPAPKLPPGANVPGAPPGKKSPYDHPLPPSNLGTGLVKAAASQLGQPYVWGGESRKEGGFDCSGLVDAALRANGVKLPFRVTTVTALKLGQSVKGQPLKPGDMIVCHNGQHMVMYAGNGKVIAAPHTGTDVQYQPVSQFLGQGLVDVRRI
jgi:cell wall-associated NlpC family hydrolase